jgi:chitinase
MAYDFAGGWDSVAGHQANIEPSNSNPASTPFSTERAVQYYQSQGIRPNKIVIGCPVYGRAFTGISGLGQAHTGIGEGTWENGVYDFKVLPLPGAEERYDEDAKATYSYDAGKKHLVSYDTPAMARMKAEGIKRHGLGGAMWWESSGDGVGERSLIGNVVSVFGNLDRRRNCLTYPQSKFENLRKGF